MQDAAKITKLFEAQVGFTEQHQPSSLGRDHNVCVANSTKQAQLYFVEQKDAELAQNRAFESLTSQQDLFQNQSPFLAYEIDQLLGLGDLFNGMQTSQTTEVLTYLPIPVAVFDRYGRCVYCNQLYASIFHQDASAVVHQLLNSFSAEAFQRLMDDFARFEQGEARLEHEHHMGNRYYWGTVSPLTYLNEEKIYGAMVLLTDITAFKRREQVLNNKNQQLTDQLKKDSLTGVLSRLCFEDVVEHYVQDESVEQICFIMFNIDHFKEYNQCVGYTQGDQVMLEWVQLLGEELSNLQHDLIRFNSEEMLVVLPQISEWSALTVAERIRQHFDEKNWRFEQEQRHLTLSAGLFCLYKKKKMSHSQIILNLQHTVQAAKRRGRNCCELYAPI